MHQFPPISSFIPSCPLQPSAFKNLIIAFSTENYARFTGVFMYPRQLNMDQTPLSQPTSKSALSNHALNS